MSVRTRVRGRKHPRGVILGVCALAIVLAGTGNGLAEVEAGSALAQSGAKVIGARVNVRAQPTTDSEVLFQVTRGEVLDVVEKKGNWYLIQDGSKRGYIFGPLVELVEAGAARQPRTRTSPVKMSSPSPSSSASESVSEAQQRDWVQKKRKHGLYKLIGGAAGVVTGFAVMGKSKPAGFGLLGAGGYFLWDGYSDRQEAGRRLRWGIAVHVDRDAKGVAYHMSW